jgi:eukaryotic-like serine/threonine-protein kinase
MFRWGCHVIPRLTRLQDSTVSQVADTSLDFDLELNAICDRFEHELRDGRNPRIEDYCVENEAMAPRLLASLLALELEYRRKHDGSFRADADDYHLRFPAHPAAVDEAIATFQQLYRIPPYRWIGLYELLEELGRGGQGVVYRARRKGLEKAEHLTALKLILPSRLTSRRDVDNFVNEVRAMAKLNHRGVLPVFDSGEDRGQPYVAMKLVGSSLDELLRTHGSVAPAEAARLIVEIARAVDYLHQHGIVHCDLKPSNILLDGEQPLITDFGLSRVLEPEAAADALDERRLEGTIPYMAPEQARGEPEKASDIHALGAILFELLTGRTPFGSGRRALTRILHEEAPSPRQVDPTVPASLDRIVRKCLRKDPNERYETAVQLAAELDRFLRKEELLHTPVDTTVQYVFLWLRQHRELTSRLTILGSILALTQFNYFVILSNKPRDPTLHMTVTVVELIWIAFSILFDRLSWTEGHHEPLRPAWIVIEVSLLTILLANLNAARTAMVLGYSLLIAISGLWSRVRLVWLTTAVCIAGYSTLILAERSEGHAWTTGTTNHDPNVVIAMFLVTGYVIAVQVERACALGAVRR